MKVRLKTVEGKEYYELDIIGRETCFPNNYSITFISNKLGKESLIIIIIIYAKKPKYFIENKFYHVIQYYHMII